jgi:hypothetical protein
MPNIKLSTTIVIFLLIELTEKTYARVKQKVANNLYFLSLRVEIYQPIN